MVIEVVLGSIAGGFLGGLVCYYTGYHRGLQKSKKYVLLPKNNNLNCKTIESSKSM